MLATDALGAPREPRGRCVRGRALEITLRAVFMEACPREKQQADRAEEKELQRVPQTQGEDDVEPLRPASADERDACRSDEQVDETEPHCGDAPLGVCQISGGSGLAHFS